MLCWQNRPPQATSPFGPDGHLLLSQLQLAHMPCGSIAIIREADMGPVMFSKCLHYLGGPCTDTLATFLNLTVWCSAPSTTPSREAPSFRRQDCRSRDWKCGWRRHPWRLWVCRLQVLPYPPCLSASSLDLLIGVCPSGDPSGAINVHDKAVSQEHHGPLLQMPM